MRRGKKISLKKPLLISLFIGYQFFIPFVMSCGTDLPYDKTQQSDNTSAAASGDSTDCDTNEFLTADCVEEVQNAEEAESTADDSADETATE